MGVKLYNVETIKNRSGKMLFEGLFDSGDIRLLLNKSGLGGFFIDDRGDWL